MPKHPGGRPTKYKPSVYTKLVEYLETCTDDIEKEVKSVSEGDKSSSTSWEIINNNNLPTKEGFAVFLDVSVDTIREWEDRHKQFSVAMKKLMTLQRMKLVNGGLSGRYNPKIVTVLLAANHGIREADPNMLPPGTGTTNIQNNYNLMLNPEAKEAMAEYDRKMIAIMRKGMNAAVVPNRPAHEKITSKN